MRKRYDIRHQVPKPSPEDVAKHMDFADVLRRAEALPPSGGEPERPQPRPAGRLRPLWLGIAALAAAAVAGIIVLRPWSAGDDGYARRAEAYFAARPFIAPPAGLPAVQFASYRVDAYRGGEFSYGSGSRIRIPAEAFHDEQGAAVRGEVDIRYREMHGPLDFFLSGIPMHYDSAGLRYQLESAGMIEIYAEQGGKRLRLRPDKPIDVALHSAIRFDEGFDRPQGYNIYHLDEAGRRWVYVASDDIVALPAAAAPALPARLQALEAEEKAALARLEADWALPPAPEAPRVSQPQREVYVVDFPKQKFPELADYSDVLWQALDSQAPSEPSGGWDELAISKAADGTYALLLSKGTLSERLRVVPVLSGIDLYKAQEAYKAQKAAYDAAVAERKALLEKAKAELAQRYAEQRRAIEAAPQGQAASPGAKRPVLSRFRIHALGIWNCDRPLAPQPLHCRLSLVGPDGQLLAERPAYLVDMASNTLEALYVSPDMPLHIDPDKRYWLWVADEDGQIWVLRPDELAALARGGQHTRRLEERRDVAGLRRELEI